MMPSAIAHEAPVVLNSKFQRGALWSRATDPSKREHRSKRQKGPRANCKMVKWQKAEITPNSQ